MIRRRAPKQHPPCPDHLAVGDAVSWTGDGLLPPEGGRVEAVYFDRTVGDWIAVVRFRTWRPSWPARLFVRIDGTDVERAA